VVHFHIHTNGTAAEEGEDGHTILVPGWVVKAVWAGLAVLAWSAALFVIVAAARELVHITD